MNAAIAGGSSECNHRWALKKNWSRSSPVSASANTEMREQRSAQDFAGRVVIVTGAWRGLGRAAAERFHERGAAVAVNVRDGARAEDLAASFGERGLALPGDIAAA